MAAVWLTCRVPVILKGDCHDGAMVAIDDAQTYARLFLETCRAALQLQYDRVLQLADVPRDTTDWRAIEPDCYLLVIALRQAILSVETVAAHFEDEPIKATVTNTLEMLDWKHGHPEAGKHHGGLQQLTDLRDMLTHFDAYLKGTGFLQPGGKLFRQRWPNPDEDPPPPREFDMHRKWRWDRHTQQVVLRVRAMEISVDVLSMSRSVMDLIDEVREAL